MSSTSAVATITDRNGVINLLNSEQAKQRITPLLGGIEYERVVGEVYLAAGENPEILECTPASIVRAVARAVSWGLTIGEQVHLIPFKVNVAKKGEDARFEKRLKAVQDYKGKAELIVHAGGAKSLDAQVVYEKEPFEYVGGSDPTLVHRPSLHAKDRGAMIGAYAVADHGFNRRPTILYMPLADIDAIRKKHSKQWKDGPCLPWYAKKTAVHQFAKLLPKNPRMAKVWRVLDEDEVDDDQLDPRGPVATVEAGEVKSGELPASDCICDRETGEVDPNCPTHGEWAGGEG